MGTVLCFTKRVGISMKKRLKVVFILILSFVILLGSDFQIYASDYYRADDIVAQFPDIKNWHIDYTQNVTVIEGGNHAQFGNYGKQKGYRDATISREEQQDIAVEAIKDFLSNL